MCSPSQKPFCFPTFQGAAATLPSQHPLPTFGHRTAFPNCSLQGHTASCLPSRSVPVSPSSAAPDPHCPPLVLQVSQSLPCSILRLASSHSSWLRPLSLGSQPYLKLSVSLRLSPALSSPAASADTFPHNHYSRLKLPECVSCFFGVFLPNTPETTRVQGAMSTCLTLHPT